MRYNISTQGMPFPDSPRVLYENSPLIEVACELRFPTILDIKASDPAGFQETVRSSYPLYSREDESGFPKEVADILAKLPIAKATEDLGHKFLTDDSSRYIALRPESLVVDETSYTQWEEFREQIRLAMSALEETYHPSFYSRVGLRYIDLIDKAEIGLADVPWESLVSPSVIGMLGAKEVSGRVRGIRSVVLISLDDVVPGGAMRVQHGLVKSEDGRVAYRIDADFFTEERSATEDVFGALDRFNGLAGNLFRWIITPELKKALEPRELP